MQQYVQFLVFINYLFSFGLEDGDIFMKNSFMRHTFEDSNTGILMGDPSDFGKGKIIDIGGGYNNRYAIVHN